MKVFAIKDEEDPKRKDLAYLFYYEKDKRFYIELPDAADPWETPLLLSSFIKKNQRTINSYWSKIWVQQRIVPTDRQNIGQVLAENGIDEYDEFNLLMLANGRCAQDSFYLEPIDEDTVKTQFSTRYEKRIEDVIVLNDFALLIFFRNGAVKRCDIGQLMQSNRLFKKVLDSKKIFDIVSILPGGYGVCWGENLTISDTELFDSGIHVPLTMNDFIRFLSDRVVSSAEASELLECSRQNINDLVIRGKLHPVKTEQKNKFFLKSEIMQRLWK